MTNASARRSMFLFAALLFCAALNGRAQDSTPPASKLADCNDAMARFAALQMKYETDVARFGEDLAKVKQEPERSAFVREHYPPNLMVDDFLQLEADVRGTTLGFSILHHLVSIGASVGPDPTQPLTAGVTRALEILAEHYAASEDLDLVFDWLYATDAAKEFLRRAARSPHRQVRGAALFREASLLTDEAQQPLAVRSVIELAPLDDPRMADVRPFYESAQKRWKQTDPDGSRDRALQLINQVIQDYGDVLTPPRTSYGPKLVKVNRIPIDELTGKQRRSLSTKCESLRFQLMHLTIGMPAPEIAGPDAAGIDRKLSSERGNVTVIMFSFKGCGPCEEMYPSNRKLIEEFRGRPFAFLGVMGDDKLETVLEAVEQKKITWPVWWDGERPGPLASRWNVVGWPEIYVLDHRGIIRYRELHGELLRMAVTKLVAEAELAGAAKP